MERKVVQIGDDQFCADPDLKIYKNGYGLTPVGSYLFYYEDGVRKKIYRDLLLVGLFGQGLEPKEAVRRAKLGTGLKDMKLHQRRARTRNATRSIKKKVYCSTKRRKFSSITEAAEYFTMSRSSLSESISKNKPINGLRFKLI
jgi:hypothetical protein